MIAERLKKARKALHYKQKDVAKDLGITTQHLSALENGKTQPSEQLLKAYSNRFNINEDWLIFGKGELFEKKYEVTRASNTLTELERLSILKRQGDITGSEFQLLKDELLAPLKASKVPQT